MSAAEFVQEPYFVDTSPDNFAVLRRRLFGQNLSQHRAASQGVQPSSPVLSRDRTTWTAPADKTPYFVDAGLDKKWLVLAAISLAVGLSRCRTSLPSRGTNLRTSWTPPLDKKAAAQLIHSPCPGFCPNRTSWTRRRTSFRPSRTSFRPSRTSLPKLPGKLWKALRFVNPKLL